MNDEQPATPQQPAAASAGASDNASIVWTICRLALMVNPSEALLRQVQRLAGKATGVEQQQLQALLIGIQQAEETPRVIAGPASKLAWSGQESADLIARIKEWGDSTGGVSVGPKWDAICAALQSPPVATAQQSEAPK